MNAIVETVPQLLAYQPALLALAILCLAVLVQNFLTAPLAYGKGQQSPGMPPSGDHGFLSFRVIRTYQNSVESLPAFGFTLLVAILLGVSASLLNWLAAIHVAFRLAFWAVYYSGAGKVAGGPRTLCFVGGLSANIIIAVACLYVLL